ncbi:cyclodeaminase/cyclohydrolase family protein [Clostridium formicaceticum]|uniref:Methenyltetrahydrofolate cyclohydrolase n=1 Tax=Clostridium formicaceticum TaxID=1497 RepID=A0AAC9RS57_9CLOT|nr:cyclodeaminase/cyclohydrolase family protein [Clostridium formicaceticum]AOY74775.1 methenyltetrahydrofolate cyclohydrolase [Clostridium formicaceticum]ARE89165.1 Methenyltetrahydrofolate cyclohydrolase [Clostridium formicaceticum]
MLTDLTVKDFLQKTASNDPVPGGGSVAALSAATAAALTEMVANLTIGRKKYVEVEEEMKEVVKNVLQVRKELIQDIDRDSDAYNEVMAAFKLPKETEEEVRSRKAAIEEATKKAALVPLSVAQKAFVMMEAVEKVVTKGNQNAVTDGAVAAMMTRTAVLSALYNVKINLGSIQDTGFVEEVSLKVREIETKIEALEKNILAHVNL